MSNIQNLSIVWLGYDIIDEHTEVEVPTLNETGAVLIDAEVTFEKHIYDYNGFDISPEIVTYNVTDYPLNKTIYFNGISIEEDEAQYSDAKVTFRKNNGSNDISIECSSINELTKGFNTVIKSKVILKRIKQVTNSGSFKYTLKDIGNRLFYRYDKAVSDIIKNFAFVREQVANGDEAQTIPLDSAVTWKIGNVEIGTEDINSIVKDLVQINPSDKTTLKLICGNIEKEVKIHISANNEVLNVSYAPASDDNSGDSSSNNMQILDIHFPPGLLDGNSTAPAIITIHGGAWSHENNTFKNEYNHMTEIITDLGLIHVNMEYESTSTIGNENNTGGENNGTNNNSGSGTENPYEIMLGNIDSALSLLDKHAEELKLNKNKIGLMGYSAGGHLALLYTLKKIYDNIYDSDYDLPIKLVISEAGPTDFSSMFNNIDSFIEANAVGQITNVLKLCNKGSIQNSDCGYCEASYKDRNSLPDLICPISPLDYAREIMKIMNNPNIINKNSNMPRVLLIYGSGTGTLGSDRNGGDGMVPFSNAKDLFDIFINRNSEDQDYQYDSNRKYNLIKLSNINHSNIPYEAANNHSNILCSEFNILKS